MLLYTTGDDSGLSNPDDGEAFAGMLPYEEQYALRLNEGVLEKGQYWDVLVEEGATEISELAATDGAEQIK
jgi:hypothetical protein